MNALTWLAVSTAFAPGERNTITLQEGLPFSAAEALIGERAELDAADIANAKQRRVGLRAQHDVAELLGIDQPARARDGILKSRCRAATGAWPSAPAGFCRFCALIALLMSVAVSPSFAILSGIHPHAHRVDLLRGQARIADARQAADLVQQIDLRVVGEEQRVVAVVGRNQADHHQKRAGDLLHHHALPLHFGRQARQRDVHFVLGLNRGGVGIGAELKGDGDGDGSVVGAAGQEVQHPVQAGQVVLRWAAPRSFRDRWRCRPDSWR